MPLPGVIRTLVSFTMQRKKDATNRYKIQVFKGFNLSKTKPVVFWLPASTCEDWQLFSTIVRKRIAKEFGIKPEEVHWTYNTGWDE